MPKQSSHSTPSSSSVSSSTKVVKLVMQPSSSPLTSTSNMKTTKNNKSPASAATSTYMNKLNLSDAGTKHDHDYQEQRQNDNTERDISPYSSTSSTSPSMNSDGSSILNNYQDQGHQNLKRLMIQSMLKQESTTYVCTDYFKSSQKKTILIHPGKGDKSNTNESKNKHYDNSDNNNSAQFSSPKSMSSMVTGTTASSTANESSSSSSLSSPTSATATPSTTSSTTTATKRRRLADVACRDKICEWMYRIINFFTIDRETAYYSLSYIDRFLMSYRVDRHTYKLLATTCLFLALKVHQPRKLILKNVVQDLSKGDFDMEDVNRMELIVLRTLLWSLNPPTPMGFTIRLIDLHEDLIGIFNKSLVLKNNQRSATTCTKASASSSSENIDNSSQSSAIIDPELLQSYSIFFVELSLFDYYFVTKKQSRIALAAILNSIEGLGLFNAVSSSSSPSSSSRSVNYSPSTSNQCKVCLYNIVMSMHNLIKFDFDDVHSCDELHQMREKLWELYENSEESASFKSGSGSFGRRVVHRDVRSGNSSSSSSSGSSTDTDRPLKSKELASSLTRHSTNVAGVKNGRSNGRD